MQQARRAVVYAMRRGHWAIAIGIEPELEPFEHSTSFAVAKTCRTAWEPLSGMKRATKTSMVIEVEAYRGASYRHST